MERLVLEFPKLARQDLEKHDKVIESLRWNKKHKKNLIKDWERHRKALRQAAEYLFEQLMDDTILKFNKQIDFINQEKQLQRINQEINEKKPDYLNRIQEKQKIQAEINEKKQQETKKKEDDRITRSLKLKTEAISYKKTKQNLLELEKAKNNKIQILETQKIQEKIRNNKEKVNKRQLIQEQKILERLEDQECIQQKKEEDQARIKNAISQYPHLPKVAIDSDRVKQPTKSVQAKKTLNDKADKVNLFPQTGFTVDNLMKDMRYRLSHILNEAGLQGSEYGKKVLQIAPHTQPRKDTIETHDFKNRLY